MSSPLMTTLVFLTFILLQSSAQTTVLFSPVKKDKYTELYTMLIYLKTPLQPSQLHLDLGSYLPWYDCARHYKSSSYKPLIYNSSLCLDLDTKVWGNCFNKPGPGCSNDTCSFYPQNPVTLKGGTGSIITDKFALPTTKNPAQLGLVSRLVFSCTDPNKYSKIYDGLAKGSTGLASLGRFNYSLSAQTSRSSSSPWIFALCLPSSSNSSGIVLFNSAGPYNFSPNKIDVSKLLTYTGLILGPKGANTNTTYWYKSPDYYIGLTSFRVNGRVVGLNQSLLAIDENGVGGTLISTSKPYTVVESSIFNALRDAFVEEAAKLNLTTYLPAEPFSVEPFTVCFEANKVPVTRLGPAVPIINLVFKSSKNFWRIYGWNSMVRIQNLGADAWCLGFVDGGPTPWCFGLLDDGPTPWCEGYGITPKTSIVIGGHQIQDNLLQFDLERQRVGFSSSLLLRSTTCANFDFKPK